MNAVERMEAINAVMSSPAIAAIIGILMLVFGAIFLYLYATGRQTEKDIRKEKRRSAKAIAAKECEIEKIKSEKKQVLWDKHRVELDVRILREQLVNARKALEWEQYKNQQLLQGAKVNEADRDAFIAERSGNTAEHIA